MQEVVVAQSVISQRTSDYNVTSRGLSGEPSRESSQESITPSKVGAARAFELGMD